MLHVSVTLTRRKILYSTTEKEKSSMYNISFSWKNEKVLYRELFSSYILFSQFFGFYKMYGCPILNTYNVSDSKCINLFIKIIVIFIK